ncbi:MAG: SDR family NAD(P)-dependent oxidoreductase [Nannocystaceae bacterium]
MTNRRRIVAFVGALARADAQQGRIRCARLDGAAATRYSYARGEVQGRTCIVTGANSGIGYEVALGLARAGATTVLLCRDEARGAAACAAIRRASGNPAVHLRLADLASLASVRRFAAEFRPISPLVR